MEWHLTAWVLTLWLVVASGDSGGYSGGYIVEHDHGIVVLPTRALCEQTARSIDALPAGVQDDVLLTHGCEEKQR